MGLSEDQSDLDRFIQEQRRMKTTYSHKFRTKIKTLAKGLLSNPHDLKVVPCDLMVVMDL